MSCIRARRWPLALAATALSVCFAGGPGGERIAWASPEEPAAADVATARDYYNEALALREADPAAARAKLAAAWALVPTPVIGIALARAEERLGLLVEAREACLAVTRLPVSPTESPNAKQGRADADAMAAQLEPRIPTARIVLTGALDAANVRVTVDGETVPRVALAGGRRMNPGKHEAHASAGDAEGAHVGFELHEREGIEVRVEVPAARVPVATIEPSSVAPAPVPATSPPEPSGARGLNVPFLAGGGVAIAGIAVGSILGGLALQTAGDLKNKCPGNDCPPQYASDVSRTKTLGNTSTVAFAIGGVGVAVAVVALFVSGSGAASRGAAATTAARVVPTADGFVVRY